MTAILIDKLINSSELINLSEIIRIIELFNSIIYNLVNSEKFPNLPVLPTSHEEESGEDHENHQTGRGDLDSEKPGHGGVELLHVLIGRVIILELVLGENHDQSDQDKDGDGKTDKLCNCKTVPHF